MSGAALEGLVARLDADTSGRSVEPALALAVVEEAERSLDAGGLPASVWHSFLDVSRRREALLALAPAGRVRWAEAAIRAAHDSGYTLETLLRQRVRSHPERTFLRTGHGTDAERWSYARIARRLRLLAATLLSLGAGPRGATLTTGEESGPRLPSRPPRVAIVADNGFETALVDLACLVHGILVSPLGPHQSPVALSAAFDELGVTLAVTDSEEQRERLVSARERTRVPFRIALTDGAAELARDADLVLGEAAAHLDGPAVDALLAAHPRLGLDEVATVLFTSGSTGAQKGVAFTIGNLVTKRFARAAALPFVGEGDVLFAYLPLYHTFGRYLELLGMLFWGGTYVFAGNPSLDTLLQGLRSVAPTGLISIPIRWKQIRDRCLAEMNGAASPEAETEAFRRVVGERLSWGLSAAGALESSAFRFFNRHGVKLSSGFGMTEATGGITMTPPGEYEDGSVGVPLPGVRVRLSEEGELQISGPYVARYLGDAPPASGEERWLPSGDVFRTRPSGHLEIVDRLKDIYKNSRGRTISPRRVEQKFEGVPGIRRTFLGGDGRDDSVLLVVPDAGDPVLAGDPQGEEARQYFQGIVAAANQDLAPFERVFSFAVLPRDFELERGELTPKGSYRRKAIEASFKDVLETLYRGPHVTLSGDGLLLRVPRWLYRDLAVLEGDLALEKGLLVDRRRNRTLPVERAGDTVRIGSLGYRVAGSVVDLGPFAHQPLLWAGNPSLASFFPVKDGWDVPLGGASPEVFLPRRPVPADAGELSAAASTAIPSPSLARLHGLVSSALFDAGEEAVAAVSRMETILRRTDLRTATLLRRRLQALAEHPELAVRCAAYRVLLLDEPVLDYDSILPAFLRSGLPFLSPSSIEAIASADLEGERLLALRRRLHAYRSSAREFPEAARAILAGILELLVRFAQHHPEDYPEVRAELASWKLHDADPALAARADELFDELASWFEARLTASTEPVSLEAWREKLAFHDGLPDAEVAHLDRILAGTTFLDESIRSAFDGESLDPRDVPSGGIWVAPVAALHRHRLYRVGVNTDHGKHFDLLLLVRDDLDRGAVEETTSWLIALSGHTDRPAVVPRFGCCRPELGALSLAYLNELTVAERMRDCARLSRREGGEPGPGPLRTLFVRALAGVFTAWERSGERIVPGAVTPSNVVVPLDDFRDGVAILSLSGWKPYTGPWTLVGPMLRNFFRETTALYPRCLAELDPAWIFDACAEALGPSRGGAFLASLRESLEAEPRPEATPPFLTALDRALRSLALRYRPPLALEAAVARYRAFVAGSPAAPADTRERALRELERLYRVEALGDLARYHLWRHTWFADAPASVTAPFDALLATLFARPGLRPTTLVELADLEAALRDEADRGVFSRLVFPAPAAPKEVEVRVVGDDVRKVVVASTLTDQVGASFTLREPIEPAEVGQLYRLFLRSGFPRAFSPDRRYLVVLDTRDQVVAGLSYSLVAPEVAQLDGIVVSAPLRGRGLATTLLDDFSARLAATGVAVITTHFVFRDVPLGRTFRYDPRWGGLARTIAAPAAETAG